MWLDRTITKLFLLSGVQFLLVLPASILCSEPPGGNPKDKSLSLRVEEIGRSLAQEKYTEGLKLANELSLEVSRRRDIPAVMKWKLLAQQAVRACEKGGQLDKVDCKPEVRFEAVTACREFWHLARTIAAVSLEGEREEKLQIRKVLEDFSGSYAKDQQIVLGYISPQFLHKGISYKDYRNALAGLFGNFDRVSYEADVGVIQMAWPYTFVQTDKVLQGRQGGKRFSLLRTGPANVDILKKEEGRWRFFGDQDWLTVELWSSSYVNRTNGDHGVGLWAKVLPLDPSYTIQSVKLCFPDDKKVYLDKKETGQCDKWFGSREVPSRREGIPRSGEYEFQIQLTNGPLLRRKVTYQGELIPPPPRVRLAREGNELVVSWTAVSQTAKYFFRVDQMKAGNNPKWCEVNHEQATACQTKVPLSLPERTRINVTFYCDQYQPGCMNRAQSLYTTPAFEWRRER